MAKKKGGGKKKHRVRPGSLRFEKRIVDFDKVVGEEYQGALAATTTGEHYQPIRLHYDLFDLPEVVKDFKELECIDFDPDQDRWVWLYMGEASKIKFPKKVKIDEDEPVVLGSFFKKGPNEIVLDLRSIERALEAIVFFDKHIPRSAAKVTDISVVNKLFEAREAISSNFDRFFEGESVVRKDPEKFLQEIEQIGSEAQDENMKRDLAVEYLESKAREPFPEIERFPTHFYEDGIISLDFALRSRQTIALQHWLGNTSYTYADFIDEITGSVNNP